MVLAPSFPSRRVVEDQCSDLPLASLWSPGTQLFAEHSSSIVNRGGFFSQNVPSRALAVASEGTTSILAPLAGSAADTGAFVLMMRVELRGALNNEQARIANMLSTACGEFVENVRDWAIRQEW